jgi:hypothetical protein
MKIENPIVFYPRRVLEALNSGFRWARLFLKFRPALKRVKADQTARAYTESSDEELNEMDSSRCSRARSRERTARRRSP